MSAWLSPLEGWLAAGAGALAVVDCARAADQSTPPRPNATDSTAANETGKARMADIPDG
jgi:hypothetical protein